MRTLADLISGPWLTPAAVLKQAATDVIAILEAHGGDDHRGGGRRAARLEQHGEVGGASRHGRRVRRCYGPEGSAEARRLSWRCSCRCLYPIRGPERSAEPESSRPPGTRRRMSYDDDTRPAAPSRARLTASCATAATRWCAGGDALDWGDGCTSEPLGVSRRRASISRGPTHVTASGCTSGYTRPPRARPASESSCLACTSGPRTRCSPRRGGYRRGERPWP